MWLIIITIGSFLYDCIGIQLSHSDCYPKWIRPQQTHSLGWKLEARQHCINYNFSDSLRITSLPNRQPLSVFLPASNCHHPDTRKRGGRDAVCWNPSEDHHASRLNNVFPMPCQTFSCLWAARQPLQPHCMKHLSLSVWSETASLIRISPLRFLRGDTHTRACMWAECY